MIYSRCSYISMAIGIERHAVNVVQNDAVQYTLHVASASLQPG